MAMSTGGGSGSMLTEINVTPLVDVMLVLLIIFMVSAPMLQTGVDVNLPQANAQTIPDDEGKLILIGPGGDLEFKAEEGDALDIALGGEPFTAADLNHEKPDELIRTLWAGGYLERLDA